MEHELLSWGAIVTAYQAERSTIPGMRIFVHRAVRLRNAEPFVKNYVVPVGPEEVDANATDELRIWRSAEAEPATKRMEGFRREQHLSPRAARHYPATIASYERFALDRHELPHVGPALWLQK